VRKINTSEVTEEAYWSPKRTMGGYGRALSEALGRKYDSTDILERHPFDVEIQRIPPKTPANPYHAHSAQWEFYHVISGSGYVRDETGVTPVVAGDTFLFKPGEAHQVRGGDGPDDLVLICIADNPIGETCYYPDSDKHIVYAGKRTLLRGAPVDYWDGEE
jgi:uncharacterized cupin superfamily protein